MAITNQCWYPSGFGTADIITSMASTANRVITMTSCPHLHPDRSCWIQLFVWTRLDSLVPAWKPALTHAHIDSFVQTNSKYDKRKRSRRVKCAVVWFKEGLQLLSWWQAVSKHQGRESFELIIQTTSSSSKICQVGWWFFFSQNIMQTVEEGRCW